MAEQNYEVKNSKSDAPFERKQSKADGPVALIILDGFGCRGEEFGNAVAQAKKPNFDRLWKEYPHTHLQASEEAVGLPEGQFGNSEVGHSNIGAGRILYQELTRLNRDIKNGDFFKNDVLQGAMKFAVENGTALHLIGLVSDGGVHSHINHLLALLDFAKEMGLKKVYVHAFTDGRDVPPMTGVGYIKQVLDKMNELGIGEIASVSGRYYAMDRDNRWDRTEKAYRVMVDGEGEKATDPIATIQASYEQKVTDEFVIPTVMTKEDGTPVGLVKDNDAIIMFNFRPDRAIQISRAFTNDTFNEFNRGPKAPHVQYVCMTKYSDKVGGKIAYKPTNLSNTLGEVLSKNGLTQLRSAETEKFPHVTFFFSGGREDMFPGEERVLVPSPKVATYDLQPEMSAYGVAEQVAKRLRSGEIDVLILNFANPDMVGHTGILEAAIKAIEAVDECLGTVMDALRERNGVALITADHGNADIMTEPDGSPCTTHTLSLVPLIVTQHGITLKQQGGVLADLAPTMLHLLHVDQPEEMTGHSLIE